MRKHSWGGLFRGFDRRAVEKLIGASLPAQTAELRYFKWQPSTDLAVYDAYVKFRASNEDYLDFVRRRNLIFFEQSGPTAHLPTAWKQSDEIAALDWWDPGPETPPDAASGTVGVYGWVLTKYEGGCVYVVISDTGHTGEFQEAIRAHMNTL
jgi:hypothetical protein